MINMKLMTKRVLIALAMATLGGCTASQWGEPGGSLCDSEISELGPDTYMATGKYGNGCGEDKMVRHAGVFCSREHLSLLIERIDPGSSMVVFHA